MNIITVGHDNGALVCFKSATGASAGVYDRQNLEFFDAAGESVPAIAALLTALDLHDRALARRELTQALAA